MNANTILNKGRNILLSIALTAGCIAPAIETPLASASGNIKSSQYNVKLMPGESKKSDTTKTISNKTTTKTEKCKKAGKSWTGTSTSWSSIIEEKNFNSSGFTYNMKMTTTKTTKKYTRGSTKCKVTINKKVQERKQIVKIPKKTYKGADAKAYLHKIAGNIPDAHLKAWMKMDSPTLTVDPAFNLGKGLDSKNAAGVACGDDIYIRRSYTGSYDTTKVGYHEFGHVMSCLYGVKNKNSHPADSTSSFKNIYKAEKNKLKVLNADYARQSSAEFFATTYAAYVCSSSTKSKLKSQCPKTHSYIGKVLSKNCG